MDRLIDNVLFITVIAVLAFTAYLSVDVDIKQREQIINLNAQVQ